MCACVNVSARVRVCVYVAPLFQMAARLCGAFLQWRRYEEKLGALMKAQLERIKATAGLSKDTFEIAARALAPAAKAAMAAL